MNINDLNRANELASYIRRYEGKIYRSKQSLSSLNRTTLNTFDFARRIPCRKKYYKNIIITEDVFMDIDISLLKRQIKRNIKIMELAVIKYKQELKQL